MSFESEPLFPRPVEAPAQFANMEEVLVEAASRVPSDEILHAQGQAALFLIDPVTRGYYTPTKGLL